MSSSIKIFNRDSGIDSLFCSVVGEYFFCEEGSEAVFYFSVSGLYLETVSDGKVLSEEVESDVGEGSVKEFDFKDGFSRVNTDSVKVGCFFVLGGGVFCLGV